MNYADLYEYITCGFQEVWQSGFRRAVLRCFPILIVAAFLPQPYGLAAPESVMCFVLFAVTLVLGLLVTVAFCMFVYVLTFFTISPQGLRIVFTSMVEFFAGAIIPLPFFPQNVKTVLELLPFASMQNVALRIYSGSMAANEIERGGRYFRFSGLLFWLLWEALYADMQKKK